MTIWGNPSAVDRPDEATSGSAATMANAGAQNTSADAAASTARPGKVSRAGVTPEALGHALARNPLFSAYQRATTTAAWDEAIDAHLTPRSEYVHALTRFAGLGAAEVERRQHQAEAMEEAEGITFRVSGETKPRIFPMDLFPRIISSETWTQLSYGLEQRARALNAFLDDIYGPQRIVAAGFLDEADLQRAPGYLDEGHLQPPGSVRAHICGMDLVCTDEGRWLVLEDNLRVPSGIVFSHFLRSIGSELLSDVISDYDLYDPAETFAMLRETLFAAMPSRPNPQSEPRIALVSSGPSDSAWFEHRRIAELVGMPVLTPDALAVIDGYLHFQAEDGTTSQLDVVYARIEKDTLFSAKGFDGVPLGAGLHDALTQRRLVFANAFGNGVADDKAIYALVPDMIRFYLSEEPLLDQVPTDLCHKPGKVDEVVENLSERVVKPVDGYGGSGITIGPECSAEELEERAQELRAHPERFIAQDIVRLSTLPTYAQDATGAKCVHPRHVDLRVFVHVRARALDEEQTETGASIAGNHMTAHTVPAALTRTAAAGSLIVNTSRGGGGKDTWIMRTSAPSSPQGRA